MTAPVIIQDYDPIWPQQFDTLRSRIAAVLGPLATSIDHVGSTAVPGLAAKPIIDLDILIRTAADLPLVITRLASLGYEHRGDLGIKGREAFRAPADVFAHHLYVCPPSSQEYRRHIAFRNHLRTHLQDATAYANLKRQLAVKFGAEREKYNEAKAEFVEEILCRAPNHLTAPA